MTDFTSLSFEKTFKAENITSNDNLFWYKTSTYNCVFEVNRRNGCARSIPLPKEYNKVFGAYRSVKFCDGMLYVLPFQVNDIVIIDTLTDKTERVPLPESFCQKYLKNFINHVYDWEDKLILYGYAPSILLFNIKTHEYEQIAEINDLLAVKPTAWFGSSVIIDEYLYTYISTTKCFLRMDLYNKSYEIITVPIEIDCDFLDGICTKGNDIWFIPREIDKPLRVCRWNTVQNSIDSFVDDNTINTGDYPFLYGWCNAFGGYIWSFPLAGEKVLSYSIENNSFDNTLNISIDGYIKHPDVKSIDFMGIDFTCDHSMLSVHVPTGKAFEVDMKKFEIKNYDIRFDGQTKKRIYEYDCELSNNHAMILESRKFNLDNYVSMLNFEK